MRREIEQLYNQGLTRREIQRQLKCSIHTINKYCRGYRGEKNDNRDLVICLRMDGYYLDEVVTITGLARQTVIEYSKGHKFVTRNDKYFYEEKKTKSITLDEQKRSKVIDMFFVKGVDVPVICRSVGYSNQTVRYIIYKYRKDNNLVVMKKKKIDKKPTQIEQRAMLGRGVESGVYELGVKLREDRDDGRLVKLLYSDLDDTPRVPISIRVRDTSISDEEAVERWKIKFKKKSVKLVK